MFRRCSWISCQSRLPIIKARGAYPTYAAPSVLQGIHHVFSSQISSLYASPTECGRTAPNTPVPLLERLPEPSSVAWPADGADQARLFAHIFSGSYLVSSGLEGANYGIIASYLEGWFKYFAETSQSLEVVQLLEEMIPHLQSLQKQHEALSQLRTVALDQRTLDTLQMAATRQMLAITNHPDGQAYLMAGGWVCSGVGHAILYEFTRRGDVFDIRVFNTGAGTGTYHARMIEGTKEKISPVYVMHSIPRHELNMSFFQALMEPQILPLWGLKEIEDSDEKILDLIYGTIGSLSGTQGISDAGTVGFITAQRAGTCACDSFIAYLRYKAGDLALFEQIRLHLRLGVLQQAAGVWQKNMLLIEQPLTRDEKNQEKNRQIDEAALFSSLLTSGAKMLISDSVKPLFLKRGKLWFTSQEAQLAQSLGIGVLFGLAKMNYETRRKALETGTPLLLDTGGSQDFSTGRCEEVLRAFIPVRSSHFNSSSLLDGVSLSGVYKPFSNPNECLSLLQNQVARIQNGAKIWGPLQVQAQIQYLIEAFPVPSLHPQDFWQRVPSSELTACMENLHALLNIYYENFRPEAIARIPEEQNVIYVLFAMQHALALRCEKSAKLSPPCSLTDYQIGSPAKLQEADPFIVLFSPSVLKRRQEILDYFHLFNLKRKDKPILHDFVSAFAELSRDQNKLREQLLTRTEFQYYLKWVENYFRSLNLLDPYTDRLSPKSLTKMEKSAFLMMQAKSFDFFMKMDQPHLGFLQKAAMFSHLAASHFIHTEENKSWAENVGDVTFFFWKEEVHYCYFNNAKSLYPKNNASVDLHGLDPSILDQRKGGEYRLRPSLQTEAVALPKLDSRNVQEPLARPLQVLDTAEHGLDAFSNRERQELFCVDFFRSDLLDSHSENLTTPFRVLCEDPQFIHRCAAFIEKGINHFWISLAKSRRQLQPTLFFIRLSGQINAWISSNQAEQSLTPEFSRQLLRKILQDETDLTKDEKKALYLHLLLSYEHHPRVFTDQEMEEILSTWFLLDRNLVSDEGVNPYSVYRVSHVVWRHMPSILEQLKRSPHLLNRIANLILRSHCAVTLENIQWSYEADFGRLSAKDGLNQYSIDLSTRTILQNGQEAYVSSSFPAEMLEASGIQRLFQGRTHAAYLCFSKGQEKICSFIDPVWGDIEISKNEDKFAVYRKGTDGLRYLFCPDLDRLSKEIPIAIRLQTVFWLPLSWEKETTSSCLLCDPISGKVRYRFHPKTGLIREEDSLVLGSSHTSFLAIESPQAVLSWKHAEGIAHIEYPLMVSQNNQSLTFDVVSKTSARGLRAVWRENPEYELAPLQQAGLLGTFSQYLVLEHVQSKRQKIAIPYLEQQKTNVLSFFPYFRRELSFKDGAGVLQINERHIKEEKTIFFAFDLQDGILRGSTPLENLFLSYLFLGQRDYPGALHYLSQISPYHRFTFEQWGRMWPVIQWMQKIGDCSVEANAILLRVFSFVREEMRHRCHFFASDQEILDPLKKIYTSYLEGANHGSSLLELSPLEEKEWREAIPIAESPIVRRSLVRKRGDQFVPISGLDFKKEEIARPSLTDLQSLFPRSEKFIPNLPLQIFFLSRTLDTYSQFYQFYHWIRTGDQTTRNYLHSLLSGRKQNTLTSILCLACLVQDPTELPEALNMEKYSGDKGLEYEYRKQYFVKIAREVFSRVGTNQAFSDQDQTTDPVNRRVLHVRPSTAPVDPLKQAAIEDLSPMTQTLGVIPLATVSTSNLDEISLYFERKSVPVSPIESPVSAWDHILFQGRQTRNQSIRFSLRKGASLASLHEHLRSREKESAEWLRLLEDHILAAAYPRPKDPMHQMREDAAMLSGHYPFKQTMSSLVALFLEGTYEGFSAALPRCTEEQIETLNRDLQAFLVEAATHAQLKRSMQRLTSLVDAPNLNPLLVHELGEEVCAVCSFDTNWRPGLVFEYVSDKRLRPQQAAYLKRITERMEGDEPFLLAHMIMGGGKTDVFASLLGRLWARKNQLSLFLTPGSQLRTVQGNLATSQWKNFRQGICTFDYGREDLTLEVLEHIHRELTGALSRQEMVVLRSEMPQILELEFASIICQPVKDVKKIEVLQKILKILRQQTAAIIDEADEVLRIDRETNFPSGEKKTPERKRLSLVSALYRHLVSDPELAMVIDENQEALSIPVYRKQIFPRLVRALVNDSLYEDVPKEHRASFERYLSGLIAEDTGRQFEASQKRSLEGLNPGFFRKFQRAQHLVEQPDLAFLQFLSQMAQHAPERAHLIALGRHLLQDILPLTLRKTINREYGRATTAKGKVVPYVAAGIPGTTEFGHPWELIAYHFQTAIYEDLSIELFSYFLRTFFKAAEQESVSYHLDIKDTPIARDFEAALGVSLTDLEKLEKQKQILQMINTDPAKKIYIEERLIAEEVTYDPNYYSSNGHNLIMFQKALIMTGTPYNRRAYPIRFASAPLLDPGSEGALIDLLIERNEEVHTVPDTSDVQGLLTEVLRASKHKKRVRALIDIGGCLLAKDNEAYAKDILEIFKSDLSVQGVVFFRIVQEKSGTRKALSLLKKGIDQPIDLLDTHLSTWKAQGIDPNQLFFFYDQWHSRGTDFPLPPQTVALAILGLHDPIHSVLQGVARCRKLTSSQNVIYALSSSAAKVIAEEEGEPPSAEVLLRRSFSNEQDLLRDHIFRHYIEEMRDVVRSSHIIQLLDQNPRRMSADLDLLMVREIDAPYDQYGKIPRQVPPMQILEAFAQQLLDRYAGQLLCLNKECKSILEHARNHLEHLPTTVSTSHHASGREQQVQCQKEKEKEVEQENEMQMQLEKEWLSHQDQAKGSPLREMKWSAPQAASLAHQIGEILNVSSCNQNCKPLREMLSDYAYVQPFPTIFESNLYATRNWHACTTTPISVISQYHKPPGQLLVIEHGPAEKKVVSGLLLSLQESEFFRRDWLPKQSGDVRMWLIDAEGHCLNQPKSPLPQTREVERLQIQMNLLNGHVDWMMQNLGKALPWFYEEAQTAKLKFHLFYLQARRHNNQQKMARLLENSLLQYHSDGIKALLTERHLGLVTEQLLPFVPERLRSHRNIPKHLRSSNILIEDLPK